MSEVTAMEAMKRLVALRDRQVTDLHTALVTASQQNELANRRILALEAELKLGRKVTAEPVWHLIARMAELEAELEIARQKGLVDTRDAPLYRAIGLSHG